MKVYTYTAQEIGLRELPPGTLRLGGFEPTTNHQDADILIIPCDIRHLSDQQIHHLPYLLGNERNHAAFCISDRPERGLGFPGIFFRADCNKTLMKLDPTTIPWPWPVNPTRDIDRFAHAPREGFQYDVCFVGWNSTPLTKQACDSCERAGLKTYFSLSSEFFGTWESQNKVDIIRDKRFEFLNVMHNSRLSLCARSIAVGVVRYRFYEAMAMGRIPVHINDGAFLPWQSRIDWGACSLSIPESDIDKTGDILKDWLAHHPDPEILERGQYGREMWLEWMDGQKWDALFGLAATERLAGRL